MTQEKNRNVTPWPCAFNDPFKLDYGFHFACEPMRFLLVELSVKRRLYFKVRIAVGY
jgi:hypothetical protein